LADPPAPGRADDQQADTRLGEVVLDRAVTAYRAALGSRLIAAYALGSLAHGGFSPLVSDVDLGLILDDPVGPEDQVTIDTVSRSVRAGGSALEQRLSVFWGTSATLQGRGPGGRFPPLDRLDLLDHGRLLTGTDVRSAVARPERTELLVAGAQFALGYLGDDVLTEIRTPSRLVSSGPRRVTKIVLFPVRRQLPAVAVAAPGLSRHPGPHTRLTTPRCRGDGFRRASFLAVFRSRAFRACEQFRRAEPSQSATAADIATQAARPIGIHH
jgi:hypothetical protein